MSIYEQIDAVNQSSLKDFGTARSPAHYIYEREESKKKPLPDCIRRGRMIDALIFEPDQAAKIQVFFGDKIRNKGEWDKFKKAHALGDYVTAAELRDCEEAVRRLMASTDNEGTQDFNLILKTAQTQVVVVGYLQGLLCKARLDFLQQSEGWVLDAKSSDDASDEGWLRICQTTGCHFQAVFYRDLLDSINIPISNFGWFVVEQHPPYGVNRFSLSFDSPDENEAAAILDARLKRIRWLPAFDKCRRENVWPSYDGTLKKIKLNRNKLERRT